MIEKIISGGQTGADLAGLHAARLCGIPTGGTAPKGYRIANVDGSDGSNPGLAELGLVEHESYSYPPRTRENVSSSDGTVWFGYDKSNGAKVTFAACDDLVKPFLINPISPQELTDWIESKGIKILNVAGNRLSDLNPNIYNDTFTLLWNAFAKKEPQIGKVYRNLNGDFFVVESFTELESDGTEMLIYRNTKNGLTKVTPKYNFIELIQKDGEFMQKFTAII